MKQKNILKWIASILIILAVLFFLQRLLVPKYVTGIVEGGRDYEVTVEFDNAGPKKMFATFAKLQKI